MSTPVPVVVASASISVAATTTTSVSPMSAISQSVERGAERGGERGAKRQRDDEQQEPGRYDHCNLSLGPRPKTNLSADRFQYPVPVPKIGEVTLPICAGLS